jgi:YaiO family outer membrane protein
MPFRRNPFLHASIASALVFLSLALHPLAATAQQAAAPSLEEQMAEARQLSTNGQRDAALALYGRLLEESPGNSDLLLARGRTFAWMNRWEESERDLVAVTKSHPTYADAWSALGDMYFWSDRPAQAAEAYTQWTALRPTEPEPYVAQGRALRDAGDFSGAARAFQQAEANGAAPAQMEGLRASLRSPSGNPADRVPEGFHWVASGTYEHTGFEGDRQPWNDYSFSLRRRFNHGSLAAEVQRVNHFGSGDTAVALDGYVDLWPRAYANLRYQYASGNRLFPHYAARGELFQGVGEGWELSGSYDRLKFSEGVNIYGLGVGRYFGNYYTRIRATHVPADDGTSSMGYRALIRNYYRGDADSYVEFRIGHGRGSDFLPGQILSRVTNGSIGASWVYFPEPQWGVKLSADYGRDTVAPNQLSVAMSVYRRW